MRRGQVGEELLALLVVGLVHEEDPGGVASGLGQFHVVLAPAGGEKTEREVRIRAETYLVVRDQNGNRGGEKRGKEE